MTLPATFDMQRYILTHVTAHPGRTAQQIAQAQTRYDRTQIVRLVRLMAAQGTLERCGDGFAASVPLGVLV